MRDFLIMRNEKLAGLRGDTLAFACDDGQSGSAAIAAAWTRICGGDDLAYWLDPRKYYPNALVYARMLAANEGPADFPGADGGRC